MVFFDRKMTICIMIVLFVICANFATSDANHYYIVPSLNVSCPQEPCLTLLQFATNISQYDGSNRNITLSFQPGNHSLSLELSVANASNFSMIVDVRAGNTTFVRCIGQSGRFHIRGSTFAWIKGLNFIGCGGNKIVRVNNFILENVTFLGVSLGWWSSLILNWVANASIIRNSFFLNSHIIGHGGAIYATDSSFSVVDSYFANISVSHRGGVVYSCNSVFTITSSKFANNRAPKGGVIYSSSLFFSISSSNFVNNSASYQGGVIYAKNNSSFTITTSNFTNNRAQKGGVIYASSSFFSISSSSFNNNASGTLQSSSSRDTSAKGGVLYAMVHSSFSITFSIFVRNRADDEGGVLYVENYSLFHIATSNFTHSRASKYGGMMYVHESSFNFTNNTVEQSVARWSGGVLYINQSPCNIIASTFTKNYAYSTGGVIRTHGSKVRIVSSIFVENIASRSSGGVIYLAYNSSLSISTSKFTHNSAGTSGGVIFMIQQSSLSIISSSFVVNNASHCGGVLTSIESSFNIASCNFTNNSAIFGVVNALYSSFNITNGIYTNNYASIGGVISTFNATFNISTSLFSNNHAKVGGVAGTFESSFRIINSNFINNRADFDGGVMYTVFEATLKDCMITIANSTFSKNKANYGGIMYITGTTIDIINSKFYQNYGSLYAFSSNVTFSGDTRFENCTEPPSKQNNSNGSHKEGGAITSYHSTVTFTGESTLQNNQARDGGAILAIDSDIIVWHKTTIANNVATNSKGGGIYLIISDFIIQGRSSVIHNHASVKGGGIHASSSSIVVQQQGYLTFMNNSADYGGGAYLEISSRMVTFSMFPGILNKEDENGHIEFIGNYADYGGAIYIADNNSVSCSFSIECFIQSVSFNKFITINVSTLNRLISFSSNTATYHGANIFGGLFDRCTPSPFATVYTDDINSAQYHYSGLTYLQTISNITLGSIASYPVRVCFCDSTDQPNCSYEMPTIEVKKGEAFSRSIVAVDQVNHSMNASIRGLLIKNARGRMGEGQQLQMVSNTCTRITYNVFSSADSEILMLFADGPCMSSVLSRRNVTIQFLNCTCSIGFQPSRSISVCECICNSTLSPYITNCNSTASSILRANTSSWITYINDTNPPGFLIYPVCPYDYCYPPGENVSMNLNLASGSDAQCAHNRSGILCGACQPNLSLSLGSSRCLPCPNHWPLVFVAIILASLIAGILLITVVLVLNMTVADGMINAIIFYANVTAPFDRIIHSSAAPSFPTVFIAWLNLDIGFDVCFVKALDAYAKTWLQLLFPVYIISLVAMVIKISEYSPRFTRLISSRRRDPVATLATLVLLSYAKLLSTTISVLSFATLNYPDDSNSTMWLVDGNVQYFQGKHIVLVIIAALIVLIGVPYTFLLFSWQWLIQIPKVKFNRWIRLNSIITAYHAPYNNKHRYWSGLLLLVRVVLYITVAVTVSNNPQIPLLMTIVLVGGLLFTKGIIGTRLYKRSSVDIVETIILLNLLLFAAFSWYNFKADSRKETAIACISTVIIFVILTGEVAYSVILSIGCTCKRKKTSGAADLDRHALLLAPLVCSHSSSDVTHSSVEIPLPMPSPNDNESNDFKSENESSFVQEIPITSSSK